MACTFGDTGFFRLQGIKVLWRLQFLGYLRILSLKFQKARTKIEVVLTLPCWLSEFSWDSQQSRPRTTSILVRAFWNLKLKVLKYSRNCSFQYILIPNFWHPLIYMYEKWKEYLPSVIASMCLLTRIALSLKKRPSAWGISFDMKRPMKTKKNTRLLLNRNIIF